MLVMRPEDVQLDGAPWPGVDSVSIERSAGREVQEFGDLGSFAAFVEVPERKVTVRVTRSADSGSFEDAMHGSEVELSFITGHGTTDRARKRVRVIGVVTRVTYEAKASGVKQVVTLAAVSSDGGVSDPVVLENV